jgi:hypothetical protein
MPIPQSRFIAGLTAAALVLTGLIASRSTMEARQRQLIPVAASSLVLNPDLYVGEHVSMMASVEQMLTPTTFSVDQDKTRSTGKDVLVIAPTLQTPVELNAYVTVIGDVVAFDPADIATRLKNYSLDLSPELVARFRGKAVVIATSVINAALEDVAKAPPPPLTEAEIAFDLVMKRVNPASSSLRTAVSESSAERTTAQTAVLKTAFAEAESFFQGLGDADDAVGWAQEAAKLALAIEEAATAGNWAEATTASGGLTQLCQQCHAAYRVRMEDGTYRVKFDL